MPILGRAWPRLNRASDLVALQYDDMLEMGCQRPRRRPTANSTANHDCTPADDLHIPLSTSFVKRRASAVDYRRMSR